VRSFPVFTDEGFYGFPPREGVVKIADHDKGKVVTPDAPRDPPSQDELDHAREWLTVRIPRLADAPLVRWRVCLYDNAPEDRFIVEKRGRVVVGAGLSGHGFKFGPALGRRLATLAME
jgi:sarcosine oxidase